ncbi:MAG: methionine biosynthesis protein MetW, partial [Planctomycetes bacterium]|nr:methionine biosynthesis protein MetW [Planctomycetota bacterium]
MGIKRDYGSRIDAKELSSLLSLMGKKVDPAILNLLLKQGAGFLSTVGTAEAPTRGDANWQYPIIASHIPLGASILDLGCGEGNLLGWMARQKNAKVQGVELDSEKVEICAERGIPVIQTDLDLGRKIFPDKCFDYVILEETLQTL